MTSLECLHEVFEAQATCWPDDIAIVFRGKSLTYEEVEHRANRLARYLRTQGAGPGELVALYLERSDRAIIAILAALKSGAAYVPIDPSCPEERVRHIIEEAEVSLLVTEDALSELAGRCGVPLLVIDAPEHEARIAGQPAEPIPREETGLSPNDLCHVVYTAGATGQPKGVMTEHRNVMEFAAAFNDVCRIEPADRLYQGFPLSSDGSIEEIWTAFSNGATLVIGPPELEGLSDETGRYMADNGVTYLSTVPTFLSMIREDVPCLRTIVVGGEPCPPELIKRWVRPGRRMLNVYGHTETTVNATAWDCEPGVPVAIGRPLKGYDLHVLDESQRAVRCGEPGELYIGGAGVTRGYLGQPSRTLGAFVRSPITDGANAATLYRTGDLVRRSSSGDFVFLGRIDGQAKTRSRRIELPEIESVLLEHRDIKAAVVTAIDVEGREELSAHVVPARSAHDSPDRDDLLNLLRRRLPPYMVPAYLDTIDALPTLAGGKVDRDRLPPSRTPLVKEKQDPVVAENDLERRIAGVCARVFQTSPMSVEDDFFLDLGGHTTHAVRLMSLLESDEQIEVSLGEVHEHPTVRELAGLVADRMEAGSQEGNQEGRQDRAQEGEQERAREGTSANPSSREVFEKFGRIQRSACVSLQALSVVALYGLAALPLLAFTHVFFLMTRGGLTVSGGIGLMICVTLFSYPVWVCLTIALKWLVVGRHKPGEWPVWSLQYFRFWLAARLHAMSGIGLVSGTPLMSLYYRMMGARVGYGCVIDTPSCVAFDLVSIDDDSCIGSETQMLGYRIENGMLRVGRIDIGRRCYVGTRCSLGLNTRMGDEARLGDLSLLADGAEVAPCSSMVGSPARPGDVPVPEVVIGTTTLGSCRATKVQGVALERRHPVLFGLSHALLVMALELFLVIALAPGPIMVLLAFSRGGFWWGVVSLLAAVPVGVVSFCLLTAGCKALALGQADPGIYKVESIFFLRKWFVDSLVAVSSALMRPVFKTVYLTPWLRMLGARVGRRAEVSTVSQITPDLVDLEDESFLSDGAIIGGRRFFRGRVQVGRNRVGRRSSVENNAILPIDRSLGVASSIGVLSTSPGSQDTSPDEADWIGSPPFRLSHGRKVGSFDETATHAPSRKLYAQRLLIDAARILVPGLITAFGVAFFVSTVMAGLSVLPAWLVWVLAPVPAAAFAFASAISVVAIKNVAMGRFEPVEEPLWSKHVWRNRVITGAYESVAAPLLVPLLGTPFVADYLRHLGCKIGTDVYVGTTAFSGFDLVELGDYSALNAGVVLQSHLIEGRVMRSSHVRIGSECSVGNMSVILCDTEMGRGSSVAPLSLLMKGESVPETGRRMGIPAGLVE